MGPDAGVSAWLTAQAVSHLTGASLSSVPGDGQVKLFSGIDTLEPIVSNTGELLDASVTWASAGETQPTGELHTSPVSH